MLLSRSEAIILLPSYQPEETLVTLASALKNEGFRVLVVDDGSGEKYSAYFEKCKEFANVISYPKNKGKGGALKTGYSYILENYKDVKCVITADGDGQHRIKDIIRVFNKFAEKDATIIAERKFDVKVPIKSKIGNDLSKFSQALCTYRYMRDNQCGLRCFPVSLLPEMIKISGNRYEYEMKVLNYLQMKEIKYICIYVQTIYEEGNKTSHFKPLLDTFLIQKSILVCGLVNIFTFIFGLVLSTIFYEFLFKDGAVWNNPMAYELSLFMASPITLVFQILTTLIFFRPKNFPKAVFRLTLFQILLLISNVITVSFFTRVCNFTIWGAYLLCLPLVMLPLYYLIKGIGLVYSSQNE